MTQNGTVSIDDYQRSNFSYFKEISLRWMDNDIYGHVNNVTYYSYFDTAANSVLIERGKLDIQNADVVGFVVASNCQYVKPIEFPGTIEVGVCVNRLGNSSVEYGIAIFSSGEERPAAFGSFTHVFVSRKGGQSVAMPDDIRDALQSIARATV